MVNVLKLVLDHVPDNPERRLRRDVGTGIDVVVVERLVGVNLLGAPSVAEAVGRVTDEVESAPVDGTRPLRLAEEVLRVGDEGAETREVVATFDSLLLGDLGESVAVRDDHLVRRRAISVREYGRPEP